MTLTLMLLFIYNLFTNEYVTIHEHSYYISFCGFFFLKTLFFKAVLHFVVFISNFSILQIFN